jgi:hypothetical protein
VKQYSPQRREAVFTAEARSGYATIKAIFHYTDAEFTDTEYFLIKKLYSAPSVTSWWATRQCVKTFNDDSCQMES